MPEKVLIGKDKAGREWEGNLRGNTITWVTTDSGPVLQGDEIVEVHDDGTMTGIKATEDVVPCTYDGENWEGDCPSGHYEEV